MAIAIDFLKGKCIYYQQSMHIRGQENYFYFYFAFRKEGGLLE